MFKKIQQIWYCWTDSHGWEYPSGEYFGEKSNLSYKNVNNKKLLFSPTIKFRLYEF